MNTARKSASTNADLIRRWFQEVWNDGRLETISELIAPNAIAHGIGEPGVPTKGPAAFQSFVTMMRNAFPDLHIKIDQVVSDGDWVATRSPPR